MKNNIKTKIQPSVEKILRTHPETRGDDFALIYYTYQELGYDNIVLNNSFKDFMLSAKNNKYKSFHSITRARRKLQNIYPELKDFETTKHRTNKIQEYIDYAKE